jgi:hypothetical protein
LLLPAPKRGQLTSAFINEQALEYYHQIHQQTIEYDIGLMYFGFPLDFKLTKLLLSEIKYYSLEKLMLDDYLVELHESGLIHENWSAMKIRMSSDPFSYSGLNIDKLTTKFDANTANIHYWRLDKLATLKNFYLMIRKSRNLTKEKHQPTEVKINTYNSKGSSNE